MLTQCTQVYHAVCNIFDIGFKTLYPVSGAVAVLRVLIIVLKVLSDQVHLLLVLLQSMQYPRICGVVANQIAKAQTLAPMFDDLDKLGALLPEILKHSTCDNLLADTVSQPATLKFLIRLQSNLLVRHTFTPNAYSTLLCPKFDFEKYIGICVFS